MLLLGFINKKLRTNTLTVNKMTTSSILILIGTFSGLLALWKNDIITKKKEIPFTEIESEAEKNERLTRQLEKAKTIKIKIFSTFLILLTLTLTFYQAHLTKISTDKEIAKKKNKAILDSIKYANDSIIYLIERKKDLIHRNLLIKKAHTDSVSFYKIESKSKQIIINQKYAIDTQDRYIKKTDLFNEYLQSELSMQKRQLFPMNILLDVETDERWSKITNSNGDSLLLNVALSFKLGIYDKVTFNNHKSPGFQQDSSLVRLNFKKVEKYHWYTQNKKIVIRSHTTQVGDNISYERKITSLLELKNKIINFHSDTSGFGIRNITLISGNPGNKQYTKLQLEELFTNAYNPDDGRWYKIIQIDK